MHLHYKLNFSRKLDHLAFRAKRKERKVMNEIDKHIESNIKLYKKELKKILADQLQNYCYT